MTELCQYVREHVERGECKCGRCSDVGNKPDPASHTADLIFFQTALRGQPTRDQFERLTREHRSEFGDGCDPLDGLEHSYLELGSWIGDQGMALEYMGLGHLLGVFDLLTPRTMFPGVEDEVALELAGRGYLMVKARAQAVAA